MITILIVVFLSFLLYYFLYYKKPSIFVHPNIAQVTFFRDYLLLTLIPYIYYIYDNNYKIHYILKQIHSNYVISQAAIHAFVFMFMFLISFKILNVSFKKSIKNININVNIKKVIQMTNTFSILLIIYFILVSINYSAGIIGLLKYNLTELNFLRHHLEHGDSFLQFNKTVIQNWIPMTSYLLYYLYLKKYLYRYYQKQILIIMIILGILASIFFFEKSVIFFYFMGLVGVYIYTGNKLNKKLVLAIPFLAIFLVAMMYTLVYQDKILDNQYLIDILIHRSTTQCVGSIMAIEYFVSHDIMGYAGVSNLWANVLGTSFQSPYAFLIDYYVPESAELSGALSSFAVGEAFALFGYIGVFLSGIIVAIYYAFLESSKHSLFTSIIFVPLYGVYFSHFYIASGFYSFVWPVGLVLVLFPFIVIVLLSVKYRRM